jgi:hypothetical protein
VPPEVQAAATGSTTTATAASHRSGRVAGDGLWSERVSAVTPQSVVITAVRPR